ncbi:unnamed protein product, partial [marine sediment metagenome]
RVIPEFAKGPIFGPIAHGADVGETVLYDASAGLITISAPLTPGVANEGDFFKVKDIFGGVAPAGVTVSGNGSPIEAPGGGGIAASQAIGATASIGVKWVYWLGVWRIIPT